jgi:adenine-specific DNA-methyltransferase
MGYRYIGSKDKLSDIVIDHIQQIKPDATHIIDLMAGTGLFSLALRENGFQVSAVDVMTYSYHHLNVHLYLFKAPLFNGLDKIELNGSDSLILFDHKDQYDKILYHLNSLIPEEGYFHKEFSLEGRPSNCDKPRNYFTATNASKIDSIRKEIRSWHSDNLITDLEHSLLLHDLIMAVNDIANIAGTYGHYLSKTIKRAKDPIQLKRTIFSRMGRLSDHEVYKGYAEEVAPLLKADFCYIDPPYIKRQYAANYHILETIAREDEPEAIGDSGLRPWRDQYSNFCSKVKIRGSFEQILRSVSVEDFLISYSEDGLLSLYDLRSFLTEFGDVTVNKIPYKRFKSNNSSKNPILNEYLIHLKKASQPETHPQLAYDLDAK